MIRTTPVIDGEQPYAWNVPSVYQCTWYGYYRAIEEGMSAPCYWDRETKTGSYTNAKEWLKNYREPWEVKGLDYTPVAGDIAVFDGEYGHIQFMETDVMFSEYRNGDPNSFRNGKFEKSSNLLGFLHYPYQPVVPVERNASVNQIQTLDESLRIRTKPSLKGDIVGYVQLGYYDVLQEKESDGYTWYQIGKDRWCANICTIYLPSQDADIIRELEKYFDSMKEKVSLLTDQNQELKDDMEVIEYVAHKWVDAEGQL